MTHDHDTRPCSRCGAAIFTPQDAVTTETLSGLFDLMWCSEACMQSDLDDAGWKTRLRREEAVFRQVQKDSGPWEIY